MPGKYGYENGPQSGILDWLAASPSNSQKNVTPLQIYLRRSCINIDILPRRLYFSFDFAILTPPPALYISAPFTISGLSIKSLH
jgi:hypothetical protein